MCWLDPDQEERDRVAKLQADHAALCEAVEADAQWCLDMLNDSRNVGMVRDRLRAMIKLADQNHA